MAKYNSPSYRNSKVVRISIGTYQLLAELATKHRLTIAEALDLFITDRTKREELVIPRTQIPMPILRVRLQPTIATNGSKVAAFRIKPKGVRYD